MNAVEKKYFADLCQAPLHEFEIPEKLHKILTKILFGVSG